MPVTKSLRSHSKTVYNLTSYILKTYFNIFLPSTQKYLSDFNKIWFSRQFNRTLQYKISQNTVQRVWQADACVRETDGRTGRRQKALLATMRKRLKI